MDKICYRLIELFENNHPYVDKDKFYRYLYLCIKAMVVDQSYDELERVFRRNDWLEDNLCALKDLLIEEDFAHSCYKPNIDKAVGMLVMLKRDFKSEYNDSFNELITLNNNNNFNKDNTTRKLILGEIQTRKLPLSYKIRVLRNENCFKSLLTYDALVYQTHYVDHEESEYEEDNETKSKIYDTLVRASINKIESDYLPIDNFSKGCVRILRKDE